jgi:hypothetical protein
MAVIWSFNVSGATVLHIPEHEFQHKTGRSFYTGS